MYGDIGLGVISSRLDNAGFRPQIEELPANTSGAILAARAAYKTFRVPTTLTAFDVIGSYTETGSAPKRSNPPSVA